MWKKRKKYDTIKKEKKEVVRLIPNEFSRAVTGWFRENGRILPWRQGRDPYRIWISEIMLQQTRIEAVIPYYHRFLETLPTVFDLALCPEDKLLKLWEGLGYYSRARNLKKAAEKIVSDFGGEMPREAKVLETLSGIGEYTAGAISSIAFGQPSPAVDGNVLRVLTRVLADRGDIALPATKKRLTAALKEIYPSGEEAALLTEGIMEIGERVCIPNGAPLCSLCPLKEMCLAFREQITDLIPVKSPKKERKKVKMTVFLLSCNGRYALRKREEKGLLSGMWEFYHTPGKLGQKEALLHLEQEGFAPGSISPCGSSTHIFTHLEWEMKGYFVTCEKEKEDLLWKTKEEIEAEYALPGAFRYFKEKL